MSSKKALENKVYLLHIYSQDKGSKCPMGALRRYYPMIGPHNEESNQKGQQEDEAIFAWDEANVL